MLRRSLLSAAIVSTIALVGAATASAQTNNPDRIVNFTFGQPVTVPGATLPAGKYRFQILDSKSDRGILRISSADGAKNFGTILAVPMHRNDTVHQTEVRFMETPAGMPPAIRSWWLPETGLGWEFAYPKAQALLFSKTAKEPVLTSDDSMTAAQMSAANLTRTSSSGSNAYAASNTPVSVSGEAEQGEVAAAAPAASASNTAMQNDASRNSMSQSDRNEARRSSLPATAGTSPLAAVAGTVALMAAFGVALWRRRVA